MPEETVVPCLFVSNGCCFNFEKLGGNDIPVIGRNVKNRFIKDAVSIEKKKILKKYLLESLKGYF